MLLKIERNNRAQCKIAIRFLLQRKRRLTHRYNNRWGPIELTHTHIIYGCVPVFPPPRVTWSGVWPQRQSSTVELHIQPYSHCRQRGRIGQNGASNGSFYSVFFIERGNQSQIEQHSHLTLAPEATLTPFLSKAKTKLCMYMEICTGNYYIVISSNPMWH